MVKSTKLIFLITAMSILCSVNIFAAHNHKYLKIWDSDEDFHWHPATCHDDAQGDIARHIFTEWEILKESTDTEEGCKFRICTVCKHENLVKLPKLEHVHIYSEDWSSDEFMHWKAPVCDHTNAIKDAARHDYSSWKVIKEATSSEEGSKKRNCKICGYEETGNKKHTYGEWISESASTCAAKGSKYKKCSVCGYKFTEEIAINEDAHKWGTDKCELCGKRRDSPGGVVNEKWMAKTGNLKINGKEILKTSEVVVVPKGEFAYINGEGDKGVFVEDRKVKLSPYVMGQYEVTRDLYKAVMGKDPSEAPANGVAGQNPVNCVTWFDAIMFCNKLSKLCGLECVYYLEIDDVNETNPDKWQKEFGEDLYYRINTFLETDLTKNGYRLPTEAEWEFAARGGSYSNSADNCSVFYRDYYYYYDHYDSGLGFRLVRSSSK